MREGADGAAPAATTPATLLKTDLRSKSEHTRWELWTEGAPETESVAPLGVPKVREGQHEMHRPHSSDCTAL